jgi:hypothetical protein
MKKIILSVLIAGFLVASNEGGASSADLDNPAGEQSVVSGKSVPVVTVRPHPCIYGTDSTRQALIEKVSNVDWAASVFKRIKDSVDSYVDQHVTDPEWMVSRLQMHWKTKYANTYVNGSHWSHGDGEAPVPTVRFAGERDWNSPYMRPKLEELQPYSDDERGIWAQNGEKEGKPWEWAPYKNTGHMIESINANIIGLAEKSAFLYWYTGEEKYAKFAADVIWPYVEGMYYRSNPITVEDHSKAGIIGLATFEVIHEGVTIPLAVAYDYLYDYLIETGRDVKMAQDLFRRWSDRIIEGGGSEGNWNINQARHIVYMGLALEGDEAYADGKGKQFYLRSFTSVTTENQKGLQDVVPERYDPVDGVWPEAPGYAFSVTDSILRLAQVIYNASGQDVLEMYPIIVPAATVAAQFLFPNGYMVGFGDTYHQVPYDQSMELLLARFRRTGQTDAELQVASILREQMALNGYRRDSVGTLLALTSYVEKIPEGEPAEPLRTRTFYADSVNFLVQRNAQNEMDGLMISLVGTKGSHVQANGMAMELYGKGMVMAPDFGRGPSYWTESHGAFYTRFAAHNTVSVDGISDYNPVHDKVVFDIVGIEPKPGSYDALSESFSFSDTEFTEPKTDAQQRRLLAIVKPSESTGYYVDIFRSKRKDGKDRKHEYIYHNVGQDVQLFGMDGKPLLMKPTDELGSDYGDHKAYNYFTDKLSDGWNRDFIAKFNVDLKKGNDACMGMWMKGEKGRTVFSAKSPVARSVSKGSVPRELVDLPVPTLIVRQDGEAWSKPFVAVFEPYLKKDGSALRNIRTLEAKAPAGDFVGLKVDTKSDGTQYILNNTDDAAKVSAEGIVFMGTYGVISENDEGVQSFYLGSGRALIKDGQGIDGQGQVVSATLEKVGDTYFYGSDKEVTISIAGRKVTVPATQRTEVKF